MQSSKQTKIINVFQISNFGIIVFLKINHEFSGLESGTILKSENSNKSWFINSRIIEFPSVETYFQNEKVINSFLNFTTIQNRNKAEENARIRSKDKIYQYQIEPILHNDKPEINETLNIIEFDKKISKKILKILLRELKFHSENGNREISNIGYLLFETSKMTGSKMIEVVHHLKFLIDEGCVVKISDEAIIYNLTEKGKNIDDVSSLV